MLRDAGVRGKIFAVLAIPTVLLVVTSGWLVGGKVQAARQAGQIEAVTDVALQLNRVVHSLQLERTVTLDHLQGVSAGGLIGVQGQRKYTNSQLQVLNDKIAASPLGTMSASIKAAAARSAKGHSGLAGVRKSIDAGTLPTADSDAAYGKIIASDLQLPGAIAASASPELASRLQAEQALSTTIESASHERDLIELAFLDGKISEAEFGQVSALIAQQTQSLQDFQRLAPIQLFVSLDRKLEASGITQLDKSRGRLSEFLNGREPDFDGSVEWQKAANPRIASMVAAEGQLVADIAGVATNIQRSEQLKAGVFGAGALFGLVLAILLAFVLGQRITLPLRRLTLAAAEIGEELPRMVERMQTPGEGPGVLADPIPVEGDDEIGRLAVAFNTVNEVTLRVAKEQAALRASIAEMFVNVARRNQVLLGRQLAQLDKMEAREENPDLLKNLFRLDHLATRMRRNAESLLVLAGIDSTRRLREAMPLSDVIRTAVGEIEAYERIDSSVADDHDVSGRHALSVAHLIAELLENATVFSNPDTRVVVASAMTGHGVDVTITDYGLGMSDAEIAQANESIANPPLAEIAVSQRLGLFVVGRIAARLGATARLRKGRTSGTVVTIGLPPDIFEGLQVDEPVVADQALEMSAAAGTSLAESPLDEPVREDALVGSIPQLASAAAARQADAPMAEVARFNPSEVALSRLPQVDVAALVADAAADVHFAAPIPADPSRRRLLPRRSRSDEPVDPSDATPEDAAAEADVSVDEVIKGVAPAEVDAVAADADVSDEAPTGTVASAHRRGSFFQRRRPGVPTEPRDQTDVQQRDSPADEPASEIPAAVPAPQSGRRRSGRGRGAERTLGATQEELPADQTAVEEPTANEPVLFEPVASVPVDVETVVAETVVAELDTQEPGTSEPTAVEGGDLAGDESVVADAVETAAHVELVRRRGLFGRRQWVADKSAAEESVAEESVAESPIEQPATEEPFTSVLETAPPQYSWPAAVDQPIEAPADEADVAHPAADEAVFEESVAAETAVEQPIDHGVAAVPARRRGLFGRRQRSAPEPDAVEAPRREPAVTKVAFDAEARSREPFPATHEPLPFAREPVPAQEPEPVAAATLYFAPAIDILPGKAMGRRGKHATPVPSYSTPATPAAPVSTSAVHPPVAPIAAPVPRRGLSTTPSGPPLQASAPAPPLSPFEQAAAEPPPVDEVPFERSLFDYAPPKVEGPVVGAAMSDMDQLALNAELQKSALSELRSLYEPAFNQGTAPSADAQAGLIRRQRRAVEAPAEVEPVVPSRTRDAAEVRGMLSGFRAGVERGRGATTASPADNDSAPAGALSPPSTDAARVDGTTTDAPSD